MASSAWAARPPIVAAAGAVSQPAARRGNTVTACLILSCYIALHLLKSSPYISFNLNNISLLANAAEVAVA